MSTRSTTHFRSTLDGESTAIIYRHSDGYPSGAGQDLLDFIELVKEQCEGTNYGTRFNDDSYLAAKYVAFLTNHFAKHANYDYKTGIQGEPSLLNFGSVGILNQDPMDIKYRYIVVCDGKGSNPTLYVQEVLSAWDSGEEDSEPMFVEDAISAELALQDSM